MPRCPKPTPLIKLVLHVLCPLIKAVLYWLPPRVLLPPTDCATALPSELQGVYSRFIVEEASTGREYCVLMETAMATSTRVARGWGTFITPARPGTFSSPFLFSCAIPTNPTQLNPGTRTPQTTSSVKCTTWPPIRCSTPTPTGRTWACSWRRRGGRLAWPALTGTQPPSLVQSHSERPHHWPADTRD